MLMVQCVFRGPAKIFKTSLYHRMYSRAYYKLRNAGEPKEACREAAQKAAQPYLASKSAKKGEGEGEAWFGV